MLQLLFEILSILAPAAILASIGVVWYRSGTDYPIEFVSNLVINIGMPALLFHTLATSQIDFSALGRMGLATLLVHVLFFSAAFAYLKAARKDWKLGVAHVVGNTGNLGLPVCFFAFGETGLAYAMAFFSVQCILLFSLGDAILAGSSSLKKLMSSPILHSIWMGLLVRYMNIPLPEFLLDATELLGQFVIPLMLITLGVSLASMTLIKLPSNLFWSVVRTFVAIVIAFLVAEIFGFEGVEKGVLVIETAAPVAVFNFLMAVRHNRDVAEVSTLILLTHLCAIIYLPILLAILLV